MNNAKVTNLIDFTKIKDIKEFVETANERIIDLENALYSILDTHRLDIAKELAADALGEDLDVYLEKDNGGVQELDFNGDDWNWPDYEDDTHF